MASETETNTSPERPFRGFFPTLGALLFGQGEQKAKPPGGMTFEQRAALIGSLLAVRKRRGQTPKRWASEIKAILTGIPALKPLADGLPSFEDESSESDSERTVERQITDIVDIALRLAEGHPISAFGGEAKYLIHETIEANLWSSGPARMIKWAAPLLVTLAFGGVIYGGIKFEGLRESANRAEVQIAEARAKVDQAALNSADTISKLKDQALQDWRRQLNEAATNQVTDFGKEIVATKKTTLEQIQQTVEMELQALPQFFAGQRTKFATAAEQEATQQLGTRRDELLRQIGATAKSAEDAISTASNNVEGTAKSAEDAMSKASTNVEDKAKEFDQRYKQLLIQLEQALTNAADPDSLKALTKTVDSLKQSVIDLVALEQQTRQLRTLIENSNDQRFLTFGTLISLLEWKDIILIVTALFAIFAAGFSWYSARTARKGHALAIPAKP